MYINDLVHKPDMVAEVKRNQMRGWLFESHCWHDKTGQGFPYTCAWCNAIANKDMVVDGKPPDKICKGNPYND